MASKSKNVSTAYLGFEGSFSAGDFNLPIAIDSCDLSTGGCGTDFCAAAPQRSTRAR